MCINLKVRTSVHLCIYIHVERFLDSQIECHSSTVRPPNAMATAWVFSNVGHGTYSGTGMCFSSLSCLAAPALNKWHMLCALRPYASAHALRTAPTPPCACSRIRLRRAGQQRLPAGLHSDHRGSCVSGRGHRHDLCHRWKLCRERRILSEWLLPAFDGSGSCHPQQGLARR